MSTKYSELRNIDVSEHMEKKGKFNYLSWAHAVDQLLLKDSNATWEYSPIQFFEDGSAMVYCTVSAFDIKRTMQLPVLDNRNNPIKSPNAMQINTAMQRCLAKSIATFGIGLYIYQGEDLPEEEIKKKNKPKEKSQEEVMKEAVAKIVKDLKASENAEVLQEKWVAYEDDRNQVKDASDKTAEWLDGQYHEILNGFKVV